jgi:hypothetical protein
MTWKSESIDKLAPALLAAQMALQPAIKESKNPAFKSKYADLNNCLDAIHAAFHPNGLVLIQLPMPGGTGEDEDGNPRSGLQLKSIIMHSSGQWISSDLPMFPDMQNSQKVGGAITYGRRYSAAAMSGLTQEDDDGETANGRGPGYDYDRNPVSNGNGHHNGNGNGRSAPPANGNGEKREYGPPTQGKHLYAWAKQSGEQYGLDVVKWLDTWGRRANLPAKFTEWPDAAVKDAYKAASVAIDKHANPNAARSEIADEHEAALAN